MWPIGIGSSSSSSRLRTTQPEPASLVPAPVEAEMLGVAPGDVLRVAQQRRRSREAIGPGLVEAHAVAREVAVVDAFDRPRLLAGQAGVERDRVRGGIHAGSLTLAIVRRWCAPGRSVGRSPRRRRSGGAGACGRAGPSRHGHGALVSRRAAPRVPGAGVGLGRVGANGGGLAAEATGLELPDRIEHGRGRAPAGPRRQVAAPRSGAWTRSAAAVIARRYHARRAFDPRRP